jgi:hypothetical protein
MDNKRAQSHVDLLRAAIGFFLTLIADSAVPLAILCCLATVTAEYHRWSSLSNTSASSPVLSNRENSPVLTRSFLMSNMSITPNC